MEPFEFLSFSITHLRFIFVTACSFLLMCNLYFFYRFANSTDNNDKFLFYNFTLIYY